MLRAGLYARVSTIDQQTLPMQLRAMREYAARRGWTVTLQVREVNSGAARREAREKMLEAARRREIDLVLVWRLDRWGPVSDGSADDPPGTGTSRCGVCIVDRGTGSEHARGPSDGRISCDFFGIRTGDTEGTNSGWPGSCPGERPTAGAADDRWTSSCGNPETTPRRRGKSRNRPSTANRSHFCSSHFGPTYFWLK
jgi:hypothetical protein